jgi:hypothetical protein
LACTAEVDELAPTGRPRWTNDDVTERPSDVPIPKLAFGSSDRNSGPGNEDVRAITDWVLSSFDPNGQGAQVRSAVSAKKIPLVYFYIAAKTSGLQDCNVGAPANQTLCHGGAAYIRGNIDRIANAHADAASKYSAALGGKPGIVHVEPDWFQYSSGEQTAPFSGDESGRYMNRIIGAIKGACPSCLVAVDISPWNPNLKGFYANWDMSKVTYGALVGKRFSPGGADGKSYGAMSDGVGKPIIISDVYGAGGGLLGYNNAWDDMGALDTAASQGVAVIVQPPGNTDHYRQVISQYRAHAGSDVPRPSSTATGGPGASGMPSTNPQTGTGAKPTASTGPSSGTKPPTSPGSSTESSSTKPASGSWKFSVSPTSNADYMEVAVTPPSGTTVSRVEAVINKTKIVMLDRTPRNTFAKETFIGLGTPVFFRAFDSTGKATESTEKPW